MASSLSTNTKRLLRPPSSSLGSLRPPFMLHSLSLRPFPSKRLLIEASGSTFGSYFRVTTFGESRGGGVGCVIDGCPPRLPLSQADLQLELDRRRPGQNKITSPRKESDTCKIASGVADGVTTGSPIKVEVPNTNQTNDLSEMSVVYRPSHADATYDFKYGGGGRSSARETIGRVAAGAVAKKILNHYAGTQGLGSPVFDKLEAELAKAVMSIPATKGFDIGSGFEGAFMRGSEHNDEFYMDEEGRIRTKTNRSGGIQGGISNGEIIKMRVAFKPTPIIYKKQRTVTRDKREIEVIDRGRRDPCVAPRGVPIVEAMVALVLVDQLMAQYAQCTLFPINTALQEPLESRSQLSPSLS
ncbi:chorismate synthase 2, chloroplastic-like isoform X4 [Salvia miltiorrhiza]|uniref:chorismate synthase 2, chloroplastic-like isoform X4 n=1 Tax=Salvia miltiorrhiza TaxID=226208 RepID=UPI0025ACB01C|nr:chorismate synthase 2, chloroplastic-like isoform X4 [Salvia miltiorrhiza]